MKSFFFILLLLLHFHIYSQNKLDNSNSIFIFTRSTELKLSFIAEDFNLKDTLSTHVGIGIRENGVYKIYNVTNDKAHLKSALVCQNLGSFIKVDGLKHYAIWELKTNKQEINKLLNILKKYFKLKIRFDHNFVLKDDNELYCSEFVNNVLKQVNGNKFNFKSIKKELNQFYKTALHRPVLKYIPVDFFIKFNLFKKIDERFYNNSSIN